MMDFNPVIALLIFVIVAGVVITFVTDPTTGIFAKMDTARQNLANDTDVGSYVPSFSLIGKLLLVIAVFIGIAYAVYQKLQDTAKSL